MHEAMQKLRWSREELGVFTTPEGTLNLGYDGKATMDAVAKRGWERWLLNQEQRVEAAEELGYDGDVLAHPCYTSQRRWLKDTKSFYQPRAAAALTATKDHRAF